MAKRIDFVDRPAPVVVLTSDVRIQASRIRIHPYFLESESNCFESESGFESESTLFSLNPNPDCYALALNPNPKPAQKALNPDSHITGPDTKGFDPEYQRSSFVACFG